MTRTLHCSISVRGALLNWNREWRWVKAADGSSLTKHQAKAAFLDHLARGIEHIPLGEPCEGFDYKTGCPGHEKKDDA
jgi:hypothetical protein